MLIHKPHDEINEKLQTQVLQNIRRKFDVLTNSCMWATVHLSKDEDDFKRVIQNMEAQKIQMIFGTVQAQMTTSQIAMTKSMDLINLWIGRVVIGEIIRYWRTALLFSSQRKCMCSVIRSCVLAENVKNILRQQERGKTIASEMSSKAQNIDHNTTSQEN